MSFNRLCSCQKSGQTATPGPLKWSGQKPGRTLSEPERALLTRNIIAGLPGKMTDAYGLETFRAMLNKHQGMNADTLRQNLFSFLERVLPVAEQLGVNLAIHPDDSPRDMLGLPRVLCTAADLNILFERLPSPANGITLLAEERR
jgi:mannonate dehydratase